MPGPVAALSLSDIGITPEDVFSRFRVADTWYVRETSGPRIPDAWVDSVWSLHCRRSGLSDLTLPDVSLTSRVTRRDKSLVQIHLSGGISLPRSKPVFGGLGLVWFVHLGSRYILNQGQTHTYSASHSFSRM